MSTRLVIPDSEIASSIGGPLSIEQVEISDISIPSVDMKGFEGDFFYTSCTVKDVVISITMNLDAHFDGTIKMPSCVPDQHVDGDVKYDPLVQSVPLGDIDIQPGNFKMSSDDTTLGPLLMKPEPIGDANNIMIIDEMKINDIDMKCTEVPLENPLAVSSGSSFPVQNPMNPNDILIEEAKMKKLQSNKISSPQVTMKNIQAQNIKMASVKTMPFVVDSGPMSPIVLSEKPTDGQLSGDATRTAPDFVVTLTMNIQKVKLEVKGGLEFKDITGSVKTDSATSDKFDMNLNIKRMKIKGLNICGMKIPELLLEL